MSRVFFCFPGEWIIVLIHFMKQMGVNTEETAQHYLQGFWEVFFFASIVGYLVYFSVGGFIHVRIYFIIMNSSSSLMTETLTLRSTSITTNQLILKLDYWTFQWYFYVRQRDRPYDWKCQPTVFMDPALERHEIIFGSLSLLCNSFVSAILATYIKNGGYTTIYYDFGQYGYFWLVAQLPVCF